MKFRKKPVVIEAVRWLGHNLDEVKAFSPGGDCYWNGSLPVAPESGVLIVRTLEGQLAASFGDWIIRGVNGEFYPCKPDIFAKTYEVVE